MGNGFTGPPAVDFYSMLSGMGDTIQQNAVAKAVQARQDNRKAAWSKFSVLDPSSPDFGAQALTIAHELGAGGDQEGALKFVQLGQTAAEHARAQANADRSYNLQVKTHNDTVARSDREWNYDPMDEREANAPRLGLKPGTPEHTAYLANGKLPDPESNTPHYSTTPIYGVDEGTGEPVIMQTGRDGKAIKSELPAGVKLSGASADATKTLATRYLDTGDEQLIQRNRFGPGQIGQQQYDKLNAEIERQRQARGMRPDEITSNRIDNKAATAAATAGARTAAVREKNLELVLNAADAAIPAALEANRALPRSEIKPLNQIIQKGQVIASDKRLVTFGMANLQLAEHWARAMNPTGVMRESDRDKALSFLDTALSNGTYEAAVGQLRTQIVREKDAVKAGGADYDHKRINGGRPIKVQSPAEASLYPPGTKLILPDGSKGVVPGTPED